MMSHGASPSLTVIPDLIRDPAVFFPAFSREKAARPRIKSGVTRDQRPQSTHLRTLADDGKCRWRCGVAVREFRIVHGGIHPLILGMEREQITRIMSEEPTTSASRLPNEDVLRYGDARVVMRDGRAVEVSLVPPARVLFQGKALFDDRSVWRELVAADGDAREVLGFVVLPRLGLTLTGFHDSDDGQRSVSAFAPGRWERFEAEMKPFQLPT
jgi:hypothetical protein